MATICTLRILTSYQMQPNLSFSEKHRIQASNTTICGISTNLSRMSEESILTKTSVAFRWTTSYFRMLRKSSQTTTHTEIPAPEC